MGKCNAVAGLICLGLVAGAAGASPAGAACVTDQVRLRGPDRAPAQFRVEVADDATERGQGLMFRDKMAASAGMLFVYDAPQRAAFWMKNTFIPLDMIFADASGRVTRVHSNAVPEDTSPIDGGDGVQFVLEINGGLAKSLGIAPGDELQHPAVDPALAAWTCGE